ncbi:hypothetical protein HK100_009432 [Physocladia obscura]|uniref:Cytochrome b561 domain-containing protein n=1 Tax=Physocladia obscura TaxID=109957 RepID=A0AAD5T3B0_9FUNG|nr:hypothetical protein HK100_009432 [Physocladia obscura]
MSSAPPSPNGGASTGGNSLGTATAGGISISTLNTDSGWAGDARMLHGVCMFVALSVLPLAAVVVARFFKSRLRWWMTLHVALLFVAVVVAAIGVYQIVPSSTIDCNNTTLASTSLATTTALAATAFLPTTSTLIATTLPTTTATTTSHPTCKPHPQFPMPSSPSFWFGSPHAALGSFILFGLLPILIVAGSYVGTTWDATRTRSPPAARMHRWAGRAFLAVATIQMQLGLSQSRAPIAISIIFWILTIGATAVVLLLARKLPPANTLQMPKPPHWASRETLRRKVEASFDFTSSPFSAGNGDGSGSGDYSTGSSSSSTVVAVAARRSRLPRLNSNSVNPLSLSPLAPTSTSVSAVSVTSSSRESSSDIAGGGGASAAVITRASESSSTAVASVTTFASVANSSLYYQNSASSSSAVSSSFQPSASAVALFQKTTTVMSIATTLKNSMIVSAASSTKKWQRYPTNVMSIDQQKPEQRIGSESSLVANRIIFAEPEQLSRKTTTATTVIMPRDDNNDDYDKKLVDRIIYLEPQEISLPRTISKKGSDNANNERQNNEVADRIIFLESEEMSLPQMVVNKSGSGNVSVAVHSTEVECVGNDGGSSALMKRVIFAEPEEMEGEEREGLHYDDHMVTIRDRIIYQEPLSLSRHATANTDN